MKVTEDYVIRAVILHTLVYIWTLSITCSWQPSDKFIFRTSVFGVNATYSP
jgi:hypothetical protein